MFAPGAIASASTASFCSTLKRRRRSTRPNNSAVAYDIDLALLLAPVPSQHPASSSRRAQGGRHRRDTLLRVVRVFDLEPANASLVRITEALGDDALEV